MMLLTAAEGAMCLDQPELSSSLRSLNSAANSGKNIKDILKKYVGNVLLGADKICFYFKKIWRMKMFLTDTEVENAKFVSVCKHFPMF